MTSDRRKKTSPPHDGELFEVTVWDWQGDILKKIREATFDEATAVQEEYADDPLVTVVIEER